jgi:hypothetical protein
MLVRIALISSILFASLLFESATGCSCFPNRPPLSETFAAAKAVFIGTAVNVTVDTTTRQRRVVFRSTEVFKGSRCQRKRFTIFTNADSAMCGLSITEGKMWQIWAQGTADRLQAYLCSESTTIVDRNIDFLRQQRGS